jgi:hypothetical protein
MGFISGAFRAMISAPGPVCGLINHSLTFSVGNRAMRL